MSSRAWVFDVDGVITSKEKVAQPEIISNLIKFLENGELVALVTGRSMDWLEKKVIAQIEEKASSTNILDRFIAVGEFGGVIRTYENGKGENQINREVAIPDDLVSEADGIIEKEFSESMFVDRTKKTLVTSEVHDGYDMEKYKADQIRLVKKLGDLLKSKGLSEKLVVHADRYGTNIKSQQANKTMAARDVLDWLGNRNLSADKFIIFGDTAPDLEIAQEFQKLGLNVEFVFVGEQEELEGKEVSFKVVSPKKHFEEGTLEYLRGIDETGAIFNQLPDQISGDF